MTFLFIIFGQLLRAFTFPISEEVVQCSRPGLATGYILQGVGVRGLSEFFTIMTGVKGIFRWWRNAIDRFEPDQMSSATIQLYKR